MKACLRIGMVTLAPVAADPTFSQATALCHSGVVTLCHVVSRIVIGWVEEHDFLTKMKQMNKFLAKGNQVKLFIKHKRGQSRDRDVSGQVPCHRCHCLTTLLQQQKGLIARIQSSVQGHGKLDGNPKVTGAVLPASVMSIPT